MSDSNPPDSPSSAENTVTPVSSPPVRNGANGNPPPGKSGKRLQTVSRQRTPSRIKMLKCFEDVHKRLAEGWTLHETAKYIQEVRKEATEVNRNTLVTSLRLYRKSIPPSELLKPRSTATGKILFERAAVVVEEGLDELVELQKLYKLQMTRINIDFVIEKDKIKKLMPSMGQEVRIAKEILTAYADLKMDLGLAKRHIGQVQVDAKLIADVAVNYQKPEVQEVLSDAQSRKKVLNLVERLLAKKAVPSLEEANNLPEVIDVASEESTARYHEASDPLDDPMGD